MSEVASSYVSLMPSARGFGRALSAQIGGEVDATGKEQGKRFGGSFIQTAKGVLAGAVIYKGLSEAASFAKNAIFGFNSTLQQSTIAFTSLLGSGKKAQTFLDQLQAFAKATPFEFEGLVKNSQLMLGMGISAKNIIPYLTGLGDSVASVGGNADVLNNTILAFSQIASKGTLSMDNMNQLLQGGVPTALKVLAAQFHVTTGQMVQMISTGKVSADKALPLLISGLEKGTSATAALGGMMDKQSTTFGGALSNINDALTQSIASAFRPFFNQTSAGLQKFATFLGSSTFTNGAQKFTQVMEQSFAKAGAVIRAIAPDVKQVFEGEVVPAFKLGQRIAGQVAQAIANIWPVVQPLAQDLRTVVVAAFQQFLKVAKQAGDALGPVTQWIANNRGPILAIGHSLASLGKTLAPLAPYLVGAFAAFKGAQAASKGVSNLKDKVTGAVDTVKEWKGNIESGIASVKNFGSQVKSGADTVRLWAMYAKDGAASALSVAKNIAVTSAGYVKNTAATLANTTATIASRVAQVATAAAAKAMAAAQWLVNAAMEANPVMLVVTALAALVAAFVLAWKNSSTFRSIVVGAFNAVKTIAMDVANFFTKTLPAAFMKIVDGLHKAWDAVVAFIKTWGPRALVVLAPFIGVPLEIYRHFSAIKGYLSSAFSSAFSTVKSWIDKIVSFVGGLPGKLAAGASKMLNAGKTLMQNLFDGLSHATGVVGDFAKAVVNKIIDGLNALIPHKLHIHIPIPMAPDVNINIPLVPNIPHLARGGMTNGPMAALIGDNRGGNELVVPMESPRTVKLLSDAMARAGLGAARGGDTYNIYESTNARQVALEISRQQRMAGRI